MPLQYALSFLAGSLSVLSPCVLPVIPLVAGSALQEHRHGLFSLAGGLVLSFTGIGLAVASAGSVLGVSQEAIRAAAALLLVAAGIVLLSRELQDRLLAALAPVSDRLTSRIAGRRFSGLGGQFLLGTLLGAVWSPCVGPTLGAAIGLASEPSGFWASAGMMLLFGTGAAIPLVILGKVSRRAFASSRERWAERMRWMKPLFGAIVAGMGLILFFGIEASIEAALLDLVPSWLNRWLTRI